MEEKEKKERRGRPKTGQKKGISFRIEEELFEKYEKIAQENGNVSIHTYIKDHLDSIFYKERKNQKRNVFYTPTPKVEKILMELSGKDIERINEVIRYQVELNLTEELLREFDSNFLFNRGQGTKYRDAQQDPEGFKQSLEDELSFLTMIRNNYLKEDKEVFYKKLLLTKKIISKMKETEKNTICKAIMES